MSLEELLILMGASHMVQFTLEILKRQFIQAHYTMDLKFIRNTKHLYVIHGIAFALLYCQLVFLFVDLQLAKLQSKLKPRANQNHKQTIQSLCFGKPPVTIKLISNKKRRRRNMEEAEQ